MNILVTGGAGFIGSHTTDALIAKGHRVRILDNLHKTVHPKGKPGYIHPQAEFVVGDVKNKDVWEKALKGIEAIYHFAAYQDYLPDFSTFFHVNTVSTALLYEILVEQKLASKIKKVIIASSQAVMGEGKYKCPACYQKDPVFLYPLIRLENQLVSAKWEHQCPRCRQVLQWAPSDESVSNPCNQYAISKYSQEQIAIQLGKRYNIPTTVMRYSIVQGARQSFYNAYSGVMRIFALALFFDRQPIIFEDGRQVRDFVNIDDIVQANLLVLEQPQTDSHIFNVGGGKAWTVTGFYDTMQEVVGKEIEPVIASYYRYGDTRHIVSDTSKLTSLGWKPNHGIRESIRAYWEYLNGQKDLDDILGFAEKHMKQLQVIRQTKRTD